MTVGYKRFLLAGAAVVCAGAEAQAQSPSANTAFVPEEIVVTARRRSEPLQEAPVAVTALSAQSLTEKSVVNVRDLGRLAPSLEVRAGGGSQTQSFIFIRGIGQSNDNPALEPGVGVYVDDVFMPRSQGGLFDLNDVAQVEVLRGPQGTLYGKNATGGALKVTSALPTGERSGSVTASYGNLNDWRLAGAFNQPLIEDRLFMRLSGSIHQRDGYSDSGTGGDKLSDVDSAAARVMLRYTPTSSFDLLFSADGYRDRSIDIGNRLIATQATPTLAAIEAVVGPLAPYVLAPGGNPHRGGGSDIRRDPDIRLSPFVDLAGTSVTATWTGDTVTLKSITAYRELHSVRLLDVDGTPLRVLNIADETEQSQFSQELQVTGTLAGGTVEYIAGAFFYDEDIDHDFRQTIAPLGVRSDRLNVIGTRSVAGYLNVSWDMTDRFSGTVGGRYTREKRTLSSTLRSLPDLTVVTPEFGAGKTFTDFSPKFEIDYRFSDDVFGYASASKGFKSGGFNTQANNTEQLAPFDPETAWSYELGLKTQTFDRRLTLNAAAFFMDYDGMQLNVFTTVNGAVLPLVTNAGRSQIHGLELEWSAALSSALSLFGSFTYNDGEYKRFDDAVSGDLSDRELLLPKYRYFVGGQYEIALSEGRDLRLSADYAWRSSAFLDAVNSPLLKQPGYELINARVTLALDNGLELALYGRNLSDTDALQSGSQALSSLGLAWAGFHQPRTYGVESVWRF